MITEAHNPFTPFATMSPSSKVWVYQANRVLTDEESEKILMEAKAFVGQWASHGSTLAANVALVHKVFLIFVVDQREVEASGCSIDKSVHFVKSIESTLSINFFDRTLLTYTDNANKLSFMRISEVKPSLVSTKISNKTLIFNNLVSTLEELRSNWYIPLENSWLSK